MTADQNPAPAPSARGPRAPVQKRGQITLQRIVGAAESLLAEAGPEATTVKAVMARAGVGPGSFYARFKGREDLMTYLRDRFIGRCVADVRMLMEPAQWQGASAAVVAAEVVRRLVRGHSRHEALLRAVWMGALHRPGGAGMERLVEVDESLMTSLTALLDPRGSHRAELRVALLQTLGALRVLILFPDETLLEPGHREQDLILALTGTVLAALGLSPEKPESYRELLRQSARLHERPGGAPP